MGPFFACGLTLVHPPPPQHAPLGVAPGASVSGRAHRDPYGLPHAATSTHFALRWGPDGAPTEPQQQAVLDHLEAAWSEGVDRLGMAPPTGSTTHFVNVYLGETGGDAPPIGFVGGYVTPDLDGAEMMVLHPDLLLSVGTYDDAWQAIVTHEFFHVLQFASGALDGGVGPFAATEQVWFWESTASWFAHAALPGNTNVPSVMGAYLLFPWLGVDHADATAPDLSAGRAYHAALFHRYLTEHVADDALMAEAWAWPDDDADPLDVLEAGLQARGTSLHAVFPGFATHNAVLDYVEGEAYDAWAEYWIYEGTDDERVLATIDTLPAQVDADATAPEAWGYQVIELPAGDDQELLVLLDGSPGTVGSPGAFHVGWVARQAGVPVHGVLGGPVEDDGWILDLRGLTDAHLVVTAQPLAPVRGEAFPFALTVDRLEPAPGTGDTGATGDTGVEPTESPTADTGTRPGTVLPWPTTSTPTDPPATASDPPAEGCGCGHSGLPSRLGLGSLVLLVARRRRH